MAESIYVDSSLLVAAVTSDDPRRPGALAWLDRHANRQLVTSAITEVEVHRALLRVRAPAAATTEVGRLLSTCELVEVTPQIRRAARALLPASLRTLDAIHVSTALAAEVGELATLDARQGVAAEEARIKVAEIK